MQSSRSSGCWRTPDGVDYEFIVVGSGIAGLYTALLAQKHGRVLVLTKSTLEDCNTRWAQGGIAAAVGDQDSAYLHYQDTLAAGAGLCDPDAVRILCEEGPERVVDLISFGVPFDTEHGRIALAREGAHSVPRVLHSGGDSTGASIETSLSASVLHSPNIDVIEHQQVTSICIENGRAVGLNCFDSQSGERRQYGGRHIVLASGGAGRLYSQTTNPEVATADGVAIAFRAGAEVVDCEFFQFHPTAFAKPGAPSFLISEAVRGEGAHLINEKGERFAHKSDDRGELAPRDVVARAISHEMSETGTDSVYLTLNHLPRERVLNRFPSIARFCQSHGIDLATDPVPVAPAAHYFMGGVKANDWGETSLPGLYACGEVACTGVHGANRLASNSLLETLVFPHRLVDQALSGMSRNDFNNGPEISIAETQPSESNNDPRPTMAEIQRLMWESVGLIRERDALKKANSQLFRWIEAMSAEPSNRGEAEIQNAALVGWLISTAALAREESRGAHFRPDFPSPSDSWRRRLAYRLAGRS